CVTGWKMTCARSIWRTRPAAGWASNRSLLRYAAARTARGSPSREYPLRICLRACRKSMDRRNGSASRTWLAQPPCGSSSQNCGVAPLVELRRHTTPSSARCSNRMYRRTGQVDPGAMEVEAAKPDANEILEFMSRLGQAYLGSGEQSPKVELLLKRIAR